MQLLGSLLKQLEERLDGVRIRATSLQDVQPGDIMTERRAELLEQAQFIVLLVTSAYLESADLIKESYRAMEKSKARMATVLPVILTDKGFSHMPFGEVVPLRHEYWNNPSLFSSEIAREIHQTIIHRVRSRLKDQGEDSEPLRARSGNGIYFRSAWTFAAVLQVLISIGVLFWFSANPVGHHIQYQAPSPFTFFFNSLVIGMAAMSLIQIFRRLFRMRGAFHRDLTEEWLGVEASEELYREVGPKRIDDMFDLSSELLTGQLGAIADRVMEKQGKNEPASSLIRRMAAEDNAVRSSASGEQDQRIGYAMAIQRNLDQFQISTSAGWGRYLLRTSILLSIALFILGLPLLNTGSFIPGLIDITSGAKKLPASAHAGNLVFLMGGAVLTALFAGFLGSIARDVVAIVEKLRR